MEMRNVLFERRIQKERAMHSFIENEEGNILALSVAAMLAMIVFASAAIDVGCLLTAKNQIQSGVDASALAGASGLIDNQTVATQRAVTLAGSNNYCGRPIILYSGDISFPLTDRVLVQTSQTVPLFFSRIVGIETAQVSAVAMAEMAPLVGTNGQRPWGIPDMSYSHGECVVIKSGQLGAPATNPSFYYPIDFPALNKGNPESGASIYVENIIYGSPYLVEIGDVLQVEPGNMVGPTRQGINELIAMDPAAYWDGNCVANSAYPGTSSPRIVKIPFYDPNDPPSSGRNSITVVGLGAFFVQEMQGKDVIGVFMNKVTHGKFGQGHSMLKGLRLVM
jgi:hypothetical protein